MGEFVNISDSEETLMLNTVFIESIKVEDQEEVDTCNDCISQSYGEWDSLG